MTRERARLVAARRRAHREELAAMRRYDARPTARRLAAYARAVDRSNAIIRAIAELNAHPTEERAS